MEALQHHFKQYLYDQYKGTAKIQAFVAAFNEEVQAYIDWCTNVGEKLSVLDPFLNEAALSYIGANLYYLNRPVLSTLSDPSTEGGYDFEQYDVGIYDAQAKRGLARNTQYSPLLQWVINVGFPKHLSVPTLYDRLFYFINTRAGVKVEFLTPPRRVKISFTTATYTAAQKEIATTLAYAGNQGLLNLPIELTFLFEVL